MSERGWRGEETKTWRGSDRVRRKTKRKTTRPQRAGACNRSYFRNRRKGFVNVRNEKEDSRSPKVFIIDQKMG